MKHLSYFLVILFIVSFDSNSVGQTANLKVVVNHINESKGKIRIGIFDNALDFKSKIKPVASAEIPVQDSIVRYTFSKLKCERIAIAVFHDSNGNGQLDTKKLGIPLEGVGFSSKVAGKLHQPVFPEASFMFKNDTTIIIELYYTKKE